MSKPLIVPAAVVEEQFNLQQLSIGYNDALAEAGKLSSAAVRRRQTQTVAGAKLSAAVDGLLAALEEGAAPEGSTAPEFANPTPFTPNADFLGGASSQSYELTTPLGPRFQSAVNNVLLARAYQSLPKFYEKSDEDIFYAFSTLTIIPGTETREDYDAEVVVDFGHVESINKRAWFLGKKKNMEGLIPDSDFTVQPVFPQFDSVAESDDAAVLNQVLVYLTLAASYGPAEGQAELQRAIHDARRLATATQTTTFTGSAISGNQVLYRAMGVRRANPLTERKPKGTRQLQPLVLPTIRRISIPKNNKHWKTDLEYSMGVQYSASWIGPASFLGVGNLAPVAAVVPTRLSDDFGSELAFKDPFSKRAHYTEILKKNATPPPVAPAFVDTNVYGFGGQKLEVNHAIGQTLLVSLTGNTPTGFYLDNVPVKAVAVDAPETIIAPPVAAPLGGAVVGQAAAQDIVAHSANTMNNIFHSAASSSIANRAIIRASLRAHVPPLAKEVPDPGKNSTDSEKVKMRREWEENRDEWIQHVAPILDAQLKQFPGQVDFVWPEILSLSQLKELSKSKYQWKTAVPDALSTASLIRGSAETAKKSLEPQEGKPILHPTANQDKAAYIVDLLLADKTIKIAEPTAAAVAASLYGGSGDLTDNLVLGGMALLGAQDAARLAVQSVEAKWFQVLLPRDLLVALSLEGRSHGVVNLAAVNKRGKATIQVALDYHTPDEHDPQYDEIKFKDKDGERTIQRSRGSAWSEEALETLTPHTPAISVDVD